MRDDPSRNKAGRAGEDPDGRVRQRSYTCATADGLRGVLACGGAVSDDRVKSAVRWLQLHANIDDVPDLRFYASSSLALAHRALSKSAKTTCAAWAEKTCSALIDSQRPDGSWLNDAIEMREDDPIVATALGLLALMRFAG